jgi:DHA3 family macrolide efflux protein-like MFS transporter
LFSTLRDRRLALLTVGHAVNGIGSWAAFVAIWGYAVYRFDIGPGGVALLTLAWGGPPVVLGPLAGVVIDRVGPRRVAIAGDLLGAVASLAMALTGDFRSLAMLAAVHGVTKAFALPAYDALPARLVEPARLFDLNAILSAATDLSIVLGPLLAAGVFSLWGNRAAFVADAVSYLVGAAVVAPLQLRPRVGDALDRVAMRARDELREGLRVVRARPVAVSLFLLGFAMWMSYGTFGVLEPLYVRDVLHASVTTLALLQVAFGVGLVGTGLLLPRVRRAVERPSSLAVVAIAAGGGAAIYGGTSFVGVAFVGVFLWGITAGLFGAPSRTLLMLATPDTTHGRVLSAWRVVQQLGHLVPVGLGPLLAGVVGVQGVLVGVGAVCALFGGSVLMLRQPAGDDVGDLAVATP